MFIKLTNATPAHKGKSIVLNSDTIVTVHSEQVERKVSDEMSVIETVTFLFCPPHGTWEVSETVDEVASLLNGNMKVKK